MSKLSDYLFGLWARLRPPFSHDDILNAEGDNALRDVEQGKRAVETARDEGTRSNERLRSAMRAARVRSSSFAQFEERIRHERQRH